MNALYFVICFLFFCGLALPAFAYIGPAVAFLSYLLGPVVAVIVAIALMVLWPFIVIYKKRKKAKEAAPDGQPDDQGKSE